MFAQACEEGLVAELFAAGCTWFPPSTGSNQAINMGAMAATEAMVSTHARNFPGRNGSPKAMHVPGIRVHRRGLGGPRQADRPARVPGLGGLSR